jgi:hypothetical protein
MSLELSKEPTHRHSIEFRSQNSYFQKASESVDNEVTKDGSTIVSLWLVRYWNFAHPLSAVEHCYFIGEGV